MPYELCRHIRTNGRRCQSPALRDENWCFFHERLHHGHRINRAVQPAPGPGAPPIIALPALGDHEAIQVGISVVVDAVARGHLDPRRAGVLLRGLQIAAKNAADIITEPSGVNIVRSYMPTLDGLALADRQMDDNSAPAPRPRKPFVEEASPKSPPEM